MSSLSRRMNSTSVSQNESALAMASNALIMACLSFSFIPHHPSAIRAARRIHCRTPCSAALRDTRRICRCWSAWAVGISSAPPVQACRTAPCNAIRLPRLEALADSRWCRRLRAVFVRHRPVLDPYRSPIRFRGHARP